MAPHFTQLVVDHMRLMEFTYVSPLARQRAFEMLQDYGLIEIAGVEQMWNEISQHFEDHFDAEGFVDTRGSIAFFRSPYSLPDEAALWIKVKRNEIPNKQPWFGLFLLERAPWIPFDASILGTLADMALPEPWNFGDKADYTILRNYLNGTLARAHKLGNNHLLNSSDGTLVSFNTGLLNRTTLKDIFVVAKTDPAAPYDPHSPRVCVEDDTRFMRSFDGRIPEVVTFFAGNNYNDIVYNASLPCRVSDEHISARVDRLPPGMPLDPRQRAGLIALAVQKTEILAKRNYKLVVPQFYMNRIQLLMPLFFTEAPGVGRPDVALVVNRETPNSYRGTTILPLDWAYMNARLLAKPESPWLSPHDIAASSAATSDSSLNEMG